LCKADTKNLSMTGAPRPLAVPEERRRLLHDLPPPVDAAVEVELVEPGGEVVFGQQLDEFARSFPAPRASTLCIRPGAEQTRARSPTP
jgi:hypothetical protein